MLLRILILIGLSLGIVDNAVSQSEQVPAPPGAATLGMATAYHCGWGSLQADGSLQGRVVTVGPSGAVRPQARALVTLSKNEAVVTTAETDADGVFTLQGLSEGVYELFAESERAFAAFSFQAVASPAPSMMNVYASSMPRGEVDEILKSMWAPQQVITQTRRFEELIGPWQPAAQSQQVAVRGGKVYGQVAFSNPMNIPEAHAVKIFRYGELLATAPVDALGQFSFGIASPGPVDVVLGGSAFASLAVEIVDEQQVAQVDAQKERFVSSAALVSSTLLVPAVGGAGVLRAEETLVGEAVPAPLVGPPMGFGGAPFGGGGGGFAGGGGFGGGGGLGGLGGLLGVAGLAVGIAALVDDDDGFDVVVGTPISIP